MAWRGNDCIMRVVQIINSFGHQSGGAERLVQDLHIDLLAAGIDAHLVSLEQCDASALENAVSLGFSSPYKPGAILALRKYLNALVSRTDVVHAHLFPTSAVVALLKKVGAIRCQTIFTEHNTSNRRREKAAFKLFDRAVYREFSEIYCISDGTRAALVGAYPHLEHKTHVITNGATLRFDHILKRKAGTKINILSVGRLARQKNYSAALRAIAMLEADINYTILGEGTERADLEALAQSLDISGNVAFEGHKPDITPFIEDADIFLIPSLWEGFGLAAVEGMNAGLPVVASDIDGLREVVGRDGACALLVPPSEPEAIATALKALIDDTQRRQAMGAAAFERSKLFNKRSMTEAYIAAYQALGREVAHV